MSDRWCARVHSSGFFFRVAGYGLLMNRGGSWLYGQRVRRARQPWRFLTVGQARFCVLLPSDLRGWGC